MVDGWDARGGDARGVHVCCASARGNIGCGECTAAQLTALPCCGAP